MVCTGNRGRSPVAEVIARNYLRRHGVLGEYDAISSGTLVSAIKEGVIPSDFKLRLITLACERGDIYSPVERQAIDGALQVKDEAALSAINLCYRKAEERFVAEEQTYRTELLLHFGIKGVKETQEQTIVQPEGIAIFSMAKYNNAQVQAIYVRRSHSPLMAVLSAYATGNPEAEIPNAFGLTKRDYLHGFECLVEQVPKALDKLLQ